jgi:hypothetical protein
MTRSTLPIIAALAALLSCSSAARAQCTKDFDCKGDRVCRDGQCVDARPGQSSGYTTHQQPAPAPSPPRPRGPLSFFQSGYATMGLLLSFHGWGGWTDENDDIDYEEDGDIDGDFMPGFRIAGYGVLSESFHIGGYWTFFKADLEVDPDDSDLADSDVTAFMNMLGLTLKFGARLAERVWFGGAADVGLLIAKGELDILFADDLEMKAMAGLVIWPRAVLDVLLVDTGAFRLAATAALGLFVVPIAGGHPYDTDDFGDDDETKSRFWWLSPALMIGVSAGA